MKIKATLFAIVLLAVVLALGMSLTSTAAQDAGPGILEQINIQLAAQGANIRAEAIDFYTLGQGRPSYRVLRQPFRWVPNDPRRVAQGTDITYMIDPTFGSTASGLSSADTEAAIDRAVGTWNSNRCLGKVDLIKRGYPGGDVTIYDFFFGYGGYGNPLVADIVNAGWFMYFQ